MKSQKLKNFFYKFRIVFFILFFGLLFALFSYYTLMSMADINQSVFSFLKSLIYNEEANFGMVSNLILSLKFININLASLLAFFSFSMFSSGLSAFFYFKLAKKYGYKDVNPARVFKKIIEWQSYKYFLIVLPLMAFALISGILLILCVLFFNFIVAVAGMNTGLVSFISAFTGFNLMFLLPVAVLFALWNWATLCFGTEIAVSEPDLDNKTISLRSKRIVFAHPGNIFLLLIYAIFIFFIIIQVKTLNIFDFKVFLSFFALNALNYAGIKYLKTSAYINSLLNYFQKAKSM